SEPPFETILQAILNQGMRLPERDIRRYHLALKTRGFVILSGIEYVYVLVNQTSKTAIICCIDSTHVL
ncbi:MAG: hypothetical protein WCS37_13685, partial [Chloroflexota bacterium]